ncbi:MAG: hypothetical protein RSA50_01845, partial [Mucinivorans sp.]
YLAYQDAIFVLNKSINVMRELKITKQTAEDKPKRLSKKQVQELNLIGHIEQVVEQSENSKLSVAFYKNVKPHTDYIGQMLELTPVQAMLISLFVFMAAICLYLRECH